MADDGAKRQKRLHALQSAARLHPLSLHCVRTADTLVRDLAAEIAEEALLEAGGTVACTDEVRALLEGAIGTLPDDGERIPKSLHTLLSKEAAVPPPRERASVPGADVFGNRAAKTAAAAETVICTNCGTALSANRFAPHLERCMLGKGRASARNARDAMRNHSET